MNWKRTKISWILWVLFLPLVGFGTYWAFERHCSSLGFKGQGIWLVFAGVLLGGGLFSVLIWMLRKRFLPELKERPAIWMLAEAVLLLTVLGIGIYLRIQRLPEGDAGEIYSIVMMKYRTPLPWTGHAGEDFYLHILHGICYLLGNTTYFCIRFHMVLSILAGIVWYFGVRSLAGPVAALCFSAFFFLSPTMTMHAVTLSAEPAILLFYGIGLLFLGMFLRKHDGLVVGYILAGAWIGITAYMDLLGFTLLVFACSLFYVERQKETEKIHGRLSAFGFLIGGTVLGFAASAGVYALLQGISYGDALLFRDLYVSFWPGSILELGKEVFRRLSDHLSDPAFLFVMAACVFGIFGFFLKKGKERISPWTAVMLFTLLAICFDRLVVVRTTVIGSLGEPLEDILLLADPFDGSALLAFCFSVIGGIGVYSVFVPDVALREKKAALGVTRGRWTIRGMIGSLRKKKEERKAALQYALDHPEATSSKNPLSRLYYEKARQKAERQREIDKVMYALNSLSNDHVAVNDYVRDPHPEEKASREGGLFHLKKHEHALAQSEEAAALDGKADETAAGDIKADETAARDRKNGETKAEEVKVEEAMAEGVMAGELRVGDATAEGDKAGKAEPEAAGNGAERAEEGRLGEAGVGKRKAGEGQNREAMPREAWGGDTTQRGADSSPNEEKPQDRHLGAGETAGHSAEKPQEEKSQEQEGRPQEEKSQNQGIRLQEEKSQDQGEKPQEEKSQNQGIRLQEEKSQDRHTGAGETAGHSAEKLQEEKSQDQGIRPQEEKSPDQGIKSQEKLQDQKLQDQGIRLQDQKLQAQGIRLQEESQNQGIKTEEEKTQGSENGRKEEKEGRSAKRRRGFGRRKGVEDVDTMDLEKREKQKEKEDAAGNAGFKPLENPLPLPKKHISNPMDYDYEVSDDDDYDIQDDEEA